MPSTTEHEICIVEGVPVLAEGPPHQWMSATTFRDCHTPLLLERYLIHYEEKSLHVADDATDEDCREGILDVGHQQVDDAKSLVKAIELTSTAVIILCLSRHIIIDYSIAIDVPNQLKWDKD